MTYLEIVQALARLSGTVDPRSIETLEGATGRIRLLADLVESAWTEIQNTYHGWRFLTVEFPDDTALLDNAPRGAHSADTLGLPNWAEWIPGTSPGTIPLTIWSPDTVVEAEDGTETRTSNRGDEQQLNFSPYRPFQRRYQTGANAIRDTARPQVFSIDLQDRLVFWPIPDAAYPVAGTYRRSAQSLSADDDVPLGIAPQYHRTLVHAGKLLLDHSDEADGNVLLADIDLPMTFQASLASLRRRYLAGGSGSLSRGTAVGQGSSFRPISPVTVVVDTG